MKQVTFRNVIINRASRDHKNMHSRTAAGRSMFRLIGECIKEGGKVEVETSYRDENRTEVMNATLTWDSE